MRGYHVMRRWLQFRLRTVVAGMLVISLPLAWFANSRREMQAEEAAIARLGADEVTWNRPTPRWLVKPSQAPKAKLNIAWFL